MSEFLRRTYPYTGLTSSSIPVLAPRPRAGSTVMAAEGSLPHHRLLPPEEGWNEHHLPWYRVQTGGRRGRPSKSFAVQNEPHPFSRCD